ncbi:ferritin-like superfamily [Fusarium oxysporum Fo47]|uniref:ferritin-like superfamily n=1 Tax=Fusarium oxysporum Fo47 TaxID=660027 RepID=UPI002869A968|nr:ferritin-like superfamily [Fusarium oxysporum Fo47]QKD57016.2 ferritin-like superfamily [Fusarium oxysporum Fo47]
MSGSNTDKVQEDLKKFSAENVDAHIQASTFTDDIQNAIRQHIQTEYKAWFFFRKLGADCLRSNVSLHGFAALWKRSAQEAFADATWLESYLVQRGGRAKPSDIPAPDIEWPDDPIDPVQPVYAALQTEKEILEDLHRLCAAAEKAGDNALEDVIESRFLRKETRHVKDLGDLLQQCVRISKQAGHGLYHLDKELRANNGVVPWASFNDPDKSDELLRGVVKDLYEAAV